jgi:hypothetical protein
VGAGHAEEIAGIVRDIVDATLAEVRADLH